MNSAELETAARALMQQKRLTLLGHSIPDGDCVGAVTALMWALANMGKDVNAIIEDGVPPTYRFLNGSERISSLIDLPPIYDCLVYLDCATRERVGERLSRLIPPAATVINIDHHISNQGYGTVNLVDAGASSTCEIVFYIIKRLNSPITIDIATSLYCGIVMDTGSFQYSNTSPRTHQIAAELLQYGVDMDLVRTRLFESKSRVEVSLQKTALDSLEFSKDGRIASMHLSYDDLTRLGAVDLHFEGTINMARSIEDVEVALLFREIEPGVIKIGFRSKQEVDVNRIAGVWGGGGHKRAAGATLRGELEAVKKVVLLKVEEHLP
ncbi:MAG: bifunctional oligoribonuclease/PAP phosphatase NrnA [Syntrophomonadaceae bacterium]|nr:bifunctional oligoribonuclease/PAP phosphatase NrnA [Syntrophomonadaceae bacterium]